jgi:hypothetical protein
VVLPPEAYLLEPLDFVSWTSNRNGYTDKLFRVESIADRNNGDQVVGLQEVDPSDYDWTPATDEIDVPDGVQIIDRAAPQGIVGFTAGPLIIDGGSSIDRPAIHMTWYAADLDDIATVKFEVRMSSPTGPLMVQDEMASPESGFYDLTKNLTGGIVYVVRAIFTSANPTRDFVWTNWITVTTPETPIFIEAFADELQELINAGSASGAVITEKVLPTPPGFQNLYRITVYGTGANANKSAGFYLFVDSLGVPGALLDIDQVAIGNLTTRQFPFVIEGGIVKIKRASIQVLQSAQIAAAQITAGHLAVGAVTAGAIASGAIDAAKIAAGAVDATKIAANAVDASKIATGAVGAGKIGPAAVTAATIAAAAVNASSIADASIITTKLAAGAVIASKIGAGAVTAGAIAAGAVTAVKIAAGAVDATKITANSITADRIRIGTITADRIKGGEISSRKYSGVDNTYPFSGAQVTINKKGAVLLIGHIGYNVNKGDELEVSIVVKGSKTPVNGGKWRLKPGDDIAGADTIVTAVDQGGGSTPRTYEMIASGSGLKSLQLIGIQIQD